MRNPIKPQNSPFLGGFDASRTETRRSVLGHRKREKTAIQTVGDKTSPDAPLRAWERAHETTHPRHPGDAVIPTPRGHPQNIPEFKNSQTRMIAWFPENIPNIPEIPTHFGMPGIWLVQAYIYISKVKFNVSLCRYMYSSASIRIPVMPGILGILGIFLANP